MKRMIPLLAAGVLLLAACGQEPEVTVNAGSGDGDATGISVTGQGRVTGIPDTLTLDLGVAVLRDSVDEATGEAARLADALIAALSDNGVAEEDIQTSNYSIWPEWDYRNETQTLRGYRVTNTVTVKIRDLDRAGATIDAATAAGGDEIVVNGLRFSIEDNEELLELARANAWNDAEEKARQLARLAGIELGTPVSIVESVGQAPTPVPYRELADEAGAATTPIQPGEQEVTVTLQVRFGI
jgi:uncharacterized protein YggE